MLKACVMYSIWKELYWYSVVMVHWWLQVKIFAIKLCLCICFGLDLHIIIPDVNENTFPPKSWWVAWISNERCANIYLYKIHDGEKTLNAGMFLSFWRSSHTDKNKKAVLPIFSECRFFLGFCVEPWFEVSQTNHSLYLFTLARFFQFKIFFFFF